MSPPIPRLLVAFVALLALTTTLPAQEADPLPGGVQELHMMVPMRDGVRLSVYLYIPPSNGPWPALLEQRYANARAQRTREEFARMASHGYVVVLQNFRGTQRSEGRYVGYRALGWGNRRTVTTRWSGLPGNPGAMAGLAPLAVPRQATHRTSWPSPNLPTWSAST